MFFIVLMAFTGLIFCLVMPPNTYNSYINESFESAATGELVNDKELVLQNNRSEAVNKCPTVLLRHGSQLMLFRDSYLVSRFSSLDEYIGYMQQQYGAQQNSSSGAKTGGNEVTTSTNAQGQTVTLQPCPILYLSPEINAQGETEYRELPDPWAGYRKADKAMAFDSHGYTDDQNPPTYNQTGPISDNPMDTNWGGVIYSQQAIDSGKYDRRTVGRPVPDVGGSSTSVPTI